MIRTRPATEDDSFAIFKLAVAMHSESVFSEFEFNPKKVLDAIGLWLGKHCLIVAEKDGEVIGMVVGSARAHVFSDDLVAGEDFFFVRQDFRGTRAAYLLMKAFVQWAHDVGAKHIRAGVSTGCGEGAERLYQHFGMKHVGGNYIAHMNRR